MRISYDWLREYVDTKIRTENISSVLTMAGHEVVAVEEKDGDSILEIEVTPNRADCLSYIGLAREVSAATNKRLKLPLVDIKTKKTIQNAIKVTIEDKSACPRYSARIIKNVSVGPSPKWLIKRIESMGLRPVNNIVDITNFVLFETGHPLHAFDLDKIVGGEIIIRKARGGEKITTIDGTERELKPHMLLIADRQRPIAVAGVMGGKETEVGEPTKNILLESAYFDPVTIRRAALSLGISTDSSYRFERGTDLAAVVKASDRAASLIRAVTKGQIGGLIDAGKKAKPQNTIMLRPAYLNKLLGTQLNAQKINDILGRLGFVVHGTSILEVKAPTFRDDVTREADLIEEVARIYGYETVSPTAQAVIPTEEEPKSKDTRQKTKLAKEILTSSGFNEIITYSLINRQALKNTMLPEEGVIEIRNPLSSQQEIMRPSLLPGAIKTVSYNISRQVYDIKIFELSNIYFEKEGSYNEEPFLTIAQYNRYHKKEKDNHAGSALFRIKGVITVLAERLGIPKLNFEKTTHPLFISDETTAVLSDNLMLGVVGEIKPDILKAFDIPGGIYATELNFKLILESSNLNRFYKTLPRFPYSYRDISFAANKAITYKEITDLIKGTGGALIEDIELLSEYFGEQITKDQRALAIRVIYRSKEKTLAEEEISRIDTAIREGLIKNFSAVLR
jgi:phenylalanyl-tRNA synthetase beta chain